MYLFLRSNCRNLGMYTLTVISVTESLARVRCIEALLALIGKKSAGFLQRLGPGLRSFSLYCDSRHGDHDDDDMILSGL